MIIWGNTNDVIVYDNNDNHMGYKIGDEGNNEGKQTNRNES